VGQRTYAAHNAFTTLTSAITQTQTVGSTFTVQNGAVFPTTGAFVVLVDPGLPAEEVMLCTVTGNVLTIQARALDGTTAQAHSSGASIGLYITAYAWNELSATAFTHAHTGADGTPQVDAQSLSGTLTRDQLASDVPRPNLLVNPSFNFWAAGTGGFNTSGAQTADGWWLEFASATVTVDRDYVADASQYRAKVTHQVNANGYCYLYQSLYNPLVQDLWGQSLTVTARVYVTPGSNDQVWVGLRFYNGTTLLTNVSGSPNTGQFWQQVTCTAAVPTNATRVDAYVAFNNGVGNPAVAAYVDWVTLAVGTKALAYTPAPPVLPPQVAQVPARIYGPNGQVLLELQTNPGDSTYVQCLTGTTAANLNAAGTSANVGLRLASKGNLPVVFRTAGTDRWEVTSDSALHALRSDCKITDPSGNVILPVTANPNTVLAGPASGSAGPPSMRRVTAADLDSSVHRPELLVNPVFRYWQRGTSFGPSAIVIPAWATVPIADAWLAWNNTPSTSISVNSAEFGGYGTSTTAHVAIPSGAIGSGQWFQFVQWVEPRTFLRFTGGNFTFSVVYSTGTANVFGLQLVSYDSSGNFTGFYSSPLNYAANPGFLSTTGNIPNGTVTLSVRIQFVTSGDVLIWAASLVPGSVAGLGPHPMYGVFVDPALDWLQCRRRYRRWGNPSNPGGYQTLSPVGYAISSTQVVFTYLFEPPMGGTPSMEHSLPAGYPIVVNKPDGSVVQVTDLSLQYADPNMAEVWATVSGMTGGAATRMFQGADARSFIAFKWDP